MRYINLESEVFLSHPETSFELNFRFETLTHNLQNASQPQKLQQHFIRNVALHCLGKVNGNFRYGVIVDRYSGKSFAGHPFLRKLASAFATLVLSVTPAGHIESVCNIEQIREQWIQQKRILSQDHGGMEFNRRVALNDDVLADEQRLIRFLHTPEMFGLYFKSLWQHTSKGSTNSYWTTDISKRWMNAESFELRLSSLDPTDLLWGDAIYQFRRGLLQEAVLSKKNSLQIVSYSALCLE